MKKFMLSLLLVGMATLVAQAQLKTPAPSPLCKMTQVVGLTEVSLEYSRPGVKDRVIFGDLVPYGEMWRTGANASTKVSFSEDVMINGEDVPAGTYALYTIPMEEEWTIILHKNLQYWGTGGDDYKMEEDLMRFNVPVFNMGDARIESLVIDVNDIRNNSASIGIGWDNIWVQFPVEFHTTKQVQESIEEVMSGPEGRDYYLAAQFYHQEDLDNGKALKWIDKAVKHEYAGFWVLKLKAEIQAAGGDYKGAIATAKESIMKAEEAGNKGYVKMNKENIDKWMKM